jgi:hypothetical protein
MILVQVNNTSLMVALDSAQAHMLATFIKNNTDDQVWARLSADMALAGYKLSPDDAFASVQQVATVLSRVTYSGGNGCDCGSCSVPSKEQVN